MRELQRTLAWVGLTVLFAVLIAPFPVFAVTVPPAMAAPAGLSFTELKMTGDEFVVLQNNSGEDITDLSNYWLEDFNNVNPLTAGASNSSQQLPAVALGNGQTLLLSAATMPTCGAAVAGHLSVNLTDSGGFLELVRMVQNADGAVTQTPGDVVSWSSSASGIIQNVPGNSKDPKAVYYRYQNGTGYAWQLADQDPHTACQLNVAVSTGDTPQPLVATLGQAAASPPAVIINLASDASASGAADTAAPTLPTADLGLLAPQITELMPNPNGTGTDGSDEFIELYNPNTVVFDLTGFTLRVGNAAFHTYTFPAGVTIGGKSFEAFYSSDTDLSMSNSGGQAVLLDPFGNTIGQSDAYGTAKDGQAWALANNTWYWTTRPTPGTTNVINQAANGTKVTAATITKAKTTSRASSVKGAATTKPAVKAPVSTSNAQDAALTTPIHPWTLALVAVAALLYGAYEYRVDLRNRVAQFRADRAARRALG